MKICFKNDDSKKNRLKSFLTLFYRFKRIVPQTLMFAASFVSKTYYFVSI